MPRVMINPGDETISRQRRDQTYGQETVDETRFLLSIAPDSGHSLTVIGRIPVGVKHDQPVCTNQIQATPTSFTAQQKNEVSAL